MLIQWKLLIGISLATVIQISILGLNIEREPLLPHTMSIHTKGPNIKITSQHSEFMSPKPKENVKTLKNKRINDTIYKYFVNILKNVRFIQC